MPERQQFTVYALLDRRTDGNTHVVVFYVGVTTNPIALRLQGHLHSARMDENRRTPCLEYIRAMLQAGATPEIIALQVGEGEAEEQKQAEDAWIAHFTERGAPLQNAQEGGGFGYRHSPETRRKMGEAIRRTKQDPARRQRQSESAKRAWQDPEKRQAWLEGIRLRGAKRAGFDTPDALKQRDEEVRALYDAGIPSAEIAARFGLTAHNGVSNAVQRARRRAAEGS